jgi:hypothetical protein
MSETQLFTVALSTVPTMIVAIIAIVNFNAGLTDLKTVILTELRNTQREMLRRGATLSNLS